MGCYDAGVERIGSGMIDSEWQGGIGLADPNPTPTPTPNQGVVDSAPLLEVGDER